MPEMESATTRCRPALELADIFRLHGEAYRQKYPTTPEQRAAMRAIEQCRTAALGGHVDECDHCGALRISYNSCRNRHCPKCGALAKAVWLEQRRAELLPVEYFHVVFTTDHAINALARWQPQAVYDLLFHTASQTLKAFGQRYLGGEVGVLAVLHTWGQTLEQHIHLHCLVTGGALSLDGSRWQPCPPGFLFPVLPLSATFRDQFCHGLARLFQQGQLPLAERCAGWSTPADVAGQLAAMRQKKREVYAQPPFGGATRVLDYLGRYVQRVALSNQRLVSLRDDQVRFEWRDYRADGQVKEMSLAAEEFIRRFLLHVLPPGFVRVRYYGLWQSSAKLRRCRALLGADPPPAPPTADETWEARLARLTGNDLRQCPVCGVGRMVRRDDLTLLAAWFNVERAISPAVRVAA